MKERHTCTYCSKIVPWDSDSSTAYGCANPCDPEPYDPVFYCKKCAEKGYESFSTRLKILEAENILEYHKPYWQMPNFIIKAMKDNNWVMSEKPHHIKKALTLSQCN